MLQLLRNWTDRYLSQQRALMFMRERMGGMQGADLIPKDPDKPGMSAPNVGKTD